MRTDLSMSAKKKNKKKKPLRQSVCHLDTPCTEQVKWPWKTFLCTSRLLSMSYGWMVFSSKFGVLIANIFHLRIENYQFFLLY